MLPDEKTLVTLQKLGPTYYGARIYETLVLLGPRRRDQAFPGVGCSTDQGE